MILDNTLQQSDAQSQKQIKDETNNIIKPMSLCGAQLFYGADGKEMTKKIKDAIKLGFRYIDVSLYQYRQREIAVGILESISEGVVQRQDLFITCKLDPHQKMGYN